MNPLKPSLIDLRQLPLCERPMEALAALEKVACGETLLVVNDHDLDPLMQQLSPVLGGGFHWWVTEGGPEVWRVIISREDADDTKDNMEAQDVQG